MKNLREIVRPFYTQCLTVNAETNVAEKMGQILADGFQSKGSVDAKSKEQLIGQIQFFWKLVPDLKWEIQEMIQDGDKVVVRSLASGTPNGNFMGVPTDGSKSFQIMTIDIHTVRDGQIAEVYHLEDWGTAFKQLAAAPSEQPKKTMYLEIINLSLKSDVTAEAFIQGNRDFEANFMKAQPGLHSRKLGKANDGTWVVINVWESIAAAQASGAAGRGNPAAGALMMMLDPSKMSMKHFEVIPL